LNQKKITLAMGNGGKENGQLISELFTKYFQNQYFGIGEDATTLPKSPHQIAMTTDSFTVTPRFFPGGNIGKLAICGTTNDLAMVGAKPQFLTISFIIEEGFDFDELEKIVKSIQNELQINRAYIIAGDTKVMPKGSIDGLIINTTGIGEILKPNISAKNLEVGDKILISRDIGKHGATIFALREELNFETNLKSDSASLFPIVDKLITSNIEIKAMRDATRGGLAAVLNEWAEINNLAIEVLEERIPISDEVLGFCEFLGLDPLNLANEGTFVLAVKNGFENQALTILNKFNSSANIIGEVVETPKNRVLLKSNYGTKRFLEMPTGEILPRIC
jgi:hydrogenase expression/formation protein HypE